MKKTIRLTIVADASGKIIAAAPTARTAHDDVQVRLNPLPGQTLHELDAQIDLKKFLADPWLMREWLSHYRVKADRSLVPKTTPRRAGKKRR